MFYNDVVISLDFVPVLWGFGVGRWVGAGCQDDVIVQNKQTQRKIEDRFKSWSSWLQLQKGKKDLLLPIVKNSQIRE